MRENTDSDDPLFPEIRYLYLSPENRSVGYDWRRIETEIVSDLLWLFWWWR
ncbi:hypothetical protein HanRHA438_Chr05g0215441 [Helianthus annuus]|nr:hypothetical protein HanRHA438_Chr08g0347771 [Helianthus annuus]KAJ0918236.1 hypothetical protein HanRHA438_Chr05g0215441 [Helianthus annuus]